MLNILLIHNEEGLRGVFSKILTPRGFKVFGVSTGNEGLRIVEKQEFDLVFVASHLDDIDGVKVLELLKRKKRELPVVLCCAMHELETAIDAVKSGAYDFIEEPYQNADILRISREILKKTGRGADAALGLEESQYIKDALRKKVLQIVSIVVAALVVIAVAVDVIYIVSNKNKKKREQEIEIVKIKKEQQELLEKKAKQEEAAKKLESAPIAVVKKVEPAKVTVTDRVFSVPYTHPSGMCRSGEYLYVCDWFSQSIYKHKVDENLTLIKTYEVGDLHPSGVAVVNDYLWVSDSWEGTVTKFKIEDELVAVKTYKVKEQNPSGLVFDGANIWLCDASAKKINKHWTDNDLTLSASFASPGESPVALYWDGKTIWSGDRDSGSVFAHKSPSALQDFDKFQNETQREKRGKFSALTGDKDSFWLAFDGTGRIYRFEAWKYKYR